MSIMIIVTIVMGIHGHDGFFVSGVVVVSMFIVYTMMSVLVLLSLSLTVILSL